MARDAIPMRARLGDPWPEPAPPAGVEVRLLRPEDTDALAGLMVASYAGTIDDEGETPEGYWLLAAESVGGKYGPVYWNASVVAVDRSPGSPETSLAGAVVVTCNRAIPLLAYALVRPSWQGRGLGSALIGRSANHLRETGAAEWTLAVTRGNPAERLYERLGFVEDQSLKTRTEATHPAGLAFPLRFNPAPPLQPPASKLLAAMVDELRQVYTEVDGYIGVPIDNRELGPPGGVYLVGWSGPDPVAGGGVRTIGIEMGEIKRMYVDPAWRGRGVGAQLLAALEDAARGLGHRKVRLDTGAMQPGAQRLYERSGYRTIPDYNHNPHATYWGEKDL